MSAAVPVLVVGAGPTGLLLAAELRRRGVECRLIDAHAGPLHWDRATVIHPRSLEVFEALGIEAAFLASGIPQRRARLHSAGAVLGEINLASCGSRYGFNLGLSEEVTETILADYLRRQGGEVQRASRLVGLASGADEVVATIAHGERTESVVAGWVVGCDGVHSASRELSGIVLSGHDIPEPWAVFDATLAGWPATYEAIFAYLDEIPVILTALPARRWRVYLRPPAPDSDLAADAAATLARYHPAVRIEAVTNPTRFHCHTKVATRFRSGRVLLAGDAAHVCSPAQGHGMNSGLQDAFNLAWKLALVCQGRAQAALLDSYEAERRPVAEAITVSGDELERAQMVSDPAARRERDRLLRGVLNDPAARHHEAIAEAELDIDYAASPIVLGDPHPALGPGQRLPDVIDLVPEGRLHALAHRPGHTALVLAGPATADQDLRRLADAIRANGDVRLIDATVAISADGNAGEARVGVADAERLGVGHLTLLVVRPDGHVGLRADRDHIAQLAAYQERLVAGGRGQRGAAATTPSTARHSGGS